MTHALRMTFLSLLFLLPGCETLGLAPPTTFNEKAAVVLGTITTVRQTATTLLNDKKITADDGQHVLTATDSARTGLDIARSLNKSNPQAATAKLDAVRAGLVAIQSYLSTRSK
jgi:hypothetical protein